MKAEETIWLVCQVRWGGFEAGVGSYVVMLLKGCNRERQKGDVSRDCRDHPGEQ